MPHSIGIRYYGIYRKVPENNVVIAKRIYESHGELNEELPPEIALSFLYDWRNKLEVEHGVKTTYIEVSGKKATIQWYVEHASPIAVSTIVAIIAATFLGIALGYALSQLALTIKETGELLSILGPENTSILLNIMFLALILVMMNPILSAISGVAKAVRRD